MPIAPVARCQGVNSRYSLLKYNKDIVLISQESEKRGYNAEPRAVVDSTQKKTVKKMSPFTPAALARGILDLARAVLLNLTMLSPVS